MAAFAQLLEDSRPDGHQGPIDDTTLLRALARWSLLPGLSHLLLEGQLGLFGPAAQHDALASAVLMASGLGQMPAQAVGNAVGKGKPSTKATS